MNRQSKRGDWTDQLPVERQLQRQLTPGDLARMSAHAETDGWYVAATGTKWRVGRMAGSDHYDLFIGAAPATFETMAAATAYLQAVLGPAGMDDTRAPTIALTVVLSAPTALAAGGRPPR